MKMPVRPPSVEQTVASLFAEGPDAMAPIIRAGQEALGSGEYLHWEKLRYRRPPRGLSHQAWWAGIKLARWGLVKDTPLVGPDGRPFVFGLPDPAPEHLHHIDQDAAGSIEVCDSNVANPATRDRYVVRSLIEEAITSSHLEGAATTRRVAKELIRSGRKPRDRDEQMILNNYAAMQRIRRIKDRPLTRRLLLDLHRLLADRTLDDPEAVGRFRKADERVEVATPYNEVLHTPPPAHELPARLKAMCAFANEQTPQYFIHPVIRSILLHFWLAYDHPFVDGNGRCARALFYWSMLRRGYWLCEFISISQIIKEAPAQYGRAFLYTETDQNDLTYFVLYHLEVIRRAIGELHDYIAAKTAEVRRAERLIRASARFNHRQLALLSHALRHPDAEYTIRSHQTSHGVVYQTARTDLLELADRELLEKRKVGRRLCFIPPGDLADRLRKPN